MTTEARSLFSQPQGFEARFHSECDDCGRSRSTAPAGATSKWYQIRNTHDPDGQRGRRDLTGRTTWHV